jgi:hypothetical protein
MSADTERVPHEPQLLTLPLLLHVYYNKQAQKRMTLQLARYEKCQKQEDCYNKHCTLNHPALHYRRKYIDGEFKELINTVTGAMVSQYGHYLVEKGRASATRTDAYKRQEGQEPQRSAVAVSNS